MAADLLLKMKYGSREMAALAGAGAGHQTCLLPAAVRETYNCMQNGLRKYLDSASTHL